jgi:hypothetical protein
MDPVDGQIIVRITFARDLGLFATIGVINFEHPRALDLGHLCVCVCSPLCRLPCTLPSILIEILKGGPTPLSVTWLLHHPTYSTSIMPVVTVYPRKEEPIKLEANQLFYFEDSQVVLQASYSTTRFILPY